MTWPCARKFSGIFALLLVCFHVNTLPAEDFVGSYVTLIRSGPLKLGDDREDRLNYAVYGQFKWINAGDGVGQTMLRGALNYRLSERVTFWLGYSHYHTRAEGLPNFSERRSYEQVSWNVGDWGKNRLKLTTRLEQRLFRDNDDVGRRIYHEARISRPLSGFGNTRLMFYLRPYFNLNRTNWGAEPGLAQFRFFLGMEFAAASELDVEAGYLNQNVFLKDAPDVMNHFLVVRLQFH